MGIQCVLSHGNSFCQVLTIGAMLLLKSAETAFYCYRQPVMEKKVMNVPQLHTSLLFSREGRASPVLRSVTMADDWAIMNNLPSIMRFPR